MNFLYPQFLFALFAIIIPIIIHLFNFQRYKKVAFSNVAFLKEVKHSTKAKSNLKHLLILLARILAIIAIVMAFAQPYFPNENQKQLKPVTGSSVFIDNSFSTENRNEQGIIFDISRELGFQLIAELPSHINHQLLTNNFTGAQQHLYPTTELTKQLQKVEIGGFSQNLENILKRQSATFDAQPYNNYIISDFQKSQFDFTTITPDSLAHTTLIPVSPVVTKNVSVDSVWFVNPIHKINQTEQIHVRIRNHDALKSVAIRVSLVLDSITKSFINIELPPSGIKDTALVFHTQFHGWHGGYIEINDAPIVFDNRFFFGFDIPKEINIFTISGGEASPNIKTAFETESYFNYLEQSESSIDFTPLKTTHLLILNEVENYSSGLISSVLRYVENGGSLVIFPSAEETQSTLNNLLRTAEAPIIGGLNYDSTRVNFIDVSDALYQDVFTESNPQVNLPNVYQHFNTHTNRNSQILLRTSSQHSFLSRTHYKQGQIYLFSVGLQSEFSNLKRHSIFLPSLFQMAFNSVPHSDTYLEIGTDKSIIIPYYHTPSAELFHVKNNKHQLDFIPEIVPLDHGIKLGFHHPIPYAGNYKITLSDSVIGGISFNYSRLESSPTYYSAKELQTIIDSMQWTNFTVIQGGVDHFKETITQQETGVPLWRWFIFLALLFLATETLLIRYFKPSVL